MSNAIDPTGPLRIPSLKLGYLILAMLAFVDLSLYGAVRLARYKNASWLHFETELQIDLPLQTDRQLYIMTRNFFRNDCEVAHVVPCDAHDSEVVRTIRNGNPPPIATTLLKNNQYSSAYNLLEELSILGADNEVELLSTYKGFDAITLSNFAVSWYLDPALHYVANRREQDAFNAYIIYANLLRPTISQGDWLSLEGIDATDLPVLTDLFCTSTDPYKRALCITGVLSALRPNPKDPSSGVFGSGIAGTAFSAYSVASFLDSYVALDPLLQTDNLKSYLGLWLWNGSGALPSPREGISGAQLAAWHYATGVRLRAYAVAQGKLGQLVARNGDIGIDIGTW